MGPEKIVETYLAKIFKQAGWLALKLTTPGFAGVPDRLLLGPNGVVVFVEVKRPGETLKAGSRQEAVFKVFVGMKLNVHVVSTKDEADELKWKYCGGKTR